MIYPVTNERLFIGIYPGGIVYSDRKREEHGDYKRLAFLPYHSLALDVKVDCPADLRAEIIQHAAGVQARKGERFSISACGHTILLGGK